MTEIITNDNVTINETHADLHCGDIPDLEKMKVMKSKFLSIILT